MNLLVSHLQKCGRFTKLFISVQLIFVGLTILDYTGLSIPLLREIFGFLYLIFVPGILLLMLIGFNKLNLLDFLLLSVGSSLSCIMLIGATINFLYPVLGISNPLSTGNLSITFIVFSSTLFLVLQITGKTSLPLFNTNSVAKGFRYLGFFTLLPLLSILATCLINIYDFHILIYFVIVFTALVPLAVIFLKIPVYHYPFIIFSMAITLLFHTSLITPNLWGSDIHREFFFANNVVSNSRWYPTIPLSNNREALQTINGMLSITILAPIFSKLCDLSLTWIFKIVYPFIYALVPVGLYRIYKIQTNKKIAFFSSLFFMSLSFFFIPMVALARQQIAELFTTLLLILLIETNFKNKQKITLITLFGISISLSHYGFAYILMFAMLPIFIFYLISREKNKIIALLPLSLFYIFTAAWYSCVARGDLVKRLYLLLNRFLKFTVGKSLNSGAAKPEVIGIFTSFLASPIDWLNMYMNIFLQIAIVIGLLYVGLKKANIVRDVTNSSFSTEHILFALSTFGLLVLFLLTPAAATYISPGRLFHISLIFLAPFALMGIFNIYHLFTKNIIGYRNKSAKRIWQIVSIFFAMFLLINSGLLHEMTGTNKNYFALNSYIDYKWFNRQEKISVLFLKSCTQENKSIYCGDENGKELLHEYFYGRTVTIRGSTKYLPNNTYVFLRSWNINNDQIIERRINMEVKLGKIVIYQSLQNSSLYSNVLIKKSIIYSNGGSQIYH